MGKAKILLRKFKTEFEIQYDNHDDDTRWAPHPAHRCDANLPNLHGEDGAHSTVAGRGMGKTVMALENTVNVWMNLTGVWPSKTQFLI